MAQAEAQMEELTVPDGGIGDFVMEDDEIEAVYGPDLDDDDDAEEFGDEGIAQFPALTKKMAAMGRNGDNALAHLEKGELVIPAALLESNPDMKETLFTFLQEQGIEEPERYVVGTDANSVNPQTGALEFFLKKIVKGVKKAIKGVGKLLKKVAPVILPIALSFTPLGPIYGAALGSGIGTLAQGGSLKDAFKSALMAGATGAAFSGFSGQGSFTQNIGDALASPGARLSQTISGAKTSLSNLGGTPAAGEQTFFSDFADPSALAGTSDAAITGADVASQAVSDVNIPEMPTYNAPTYADNISAELGVSGTPSAGTPSAGTPNAGATSVGGTQLSTPYEPSSFREQFVGALNPNDNIGFMEGMSEAFMPSGPTPEQITQVGDEAFEQAYNKALKLPGMTPEVAAQQASRARTLAETAAKAGPGMLRQYGPMAAAGLGLAAATGAFDQVPADELGIVDRGADGSVITGSDLIKQDPGRYLIRDLGDRVLDEETGEYVSRDELEQRQTARDIEAQYAQYAPTGMQQPLLQNMPISPFDRPYVIQAAEGGPIFPRRNGGIMPNEGIPDEDSVRAMLMPGEFVMTKDAVRGLGNGNLNTGIKNMYSVMRNLERRGKRMA